MSSVVGATGLNEMESLVEEFNCFWETGVVGRLPELTDGATHLNPLFLYSNVGGEQCVIHYSTAPILGFHHGVAFTETLPGSLSDSVTPYTKAASLEDNVRRLARTAVLEFKSWCVAFNSAAMSRDESDLIIHNFNGDALEFCYSLRTALGKMDPAADLFKTCSAPWNEIVSLAPIQNSFVHSTR